MKRFLIKILLVAVLCMSGCANTELQPVSKQDVLSEYLENIAHFDVPTREVGELTSYVDMTKEMVVGVLYPETEYGFLNTTIHNWAVETAQFYKNEYMTDDENDEPMELTVDYESFCVSDSYISIKLKGVFMSSALAHPIDIVNTFNVNTKERRFVTIEDVFTSDGLEAFRVKIAEVAGVDYDRIDENITNNIVLKKEGIEIILNRGDYLPMSDGEKTLLFSYQDIEELLNESFDLNPHSVEEQEPEAEEQTAEEFVPLAQTESVEKKVIALTFDDGPSIHTERLLDILAKHGGKGTFFVVGNLVDNRPQTVNRIVNEGHQIANHGWDHRQLTRLGYKGVKDQIMMTKAKIFDVTGVDANIVRPPYGSCNDVVKAVGAEVGVAFVNWSVDTLDWKTKNPQKIYNEIMKNAKNGSIVLCHDIYKTTVDAMELVIPELVENGYELLTVNELLGEEFETGKMYYKK